MEGVMGYQFIRSNLAAVLKKALPWTTSLSSDATTTTISQGDGCDYPVDIFKVDFSKKIVKSIVYVLSHMLFFLSYDIFFFEN